MYGEYVRRGGECMGWGVCEVGSVWGVCEERWGVYGMGSM